MAIFKPGVGASFATTADENAVTITPSHATYTGSAVRIVTTRAASSAYYHLYATSNAVETAFIRGDGLGKFAAGVEVTGGTSAAGRITGDATSGLVVRGIVGATYDVEIASATGASVIRVPTGTNTAQTTASAAGGAGFRLPHGTAPTSPVNGDVWTTTAGLFVRINGATVGPLS